MDRHFTWVTLIATLLAATSLSCRSFRTDHVRRVQRTGASHTVPLKTAGSFLRANTDDLGVRLAYAKALKEAGRPEEARNVLAAPGEDLQGATRLARLAEVSGPEERPGLARRAYSADPAHSEAIANLGMLLRHEGLVAESIEVLRSGAEACAFDARIHLELSFSLAQAGNRADAYSYLILGLFIDLRSDESIPNMAHEFLARLYEGHPQWPDAPAEFRSRIDQALSSAELATIPILPASESVADLPRPLYSSPALGITFETWNEDPRTILGVAPESMADRAGLAAGDVLVRVGDRPVQSPEQAWAQFELMTQDNLPDLTVERDSALVQAPLTYIPKDEYDRVCRRLVSTAAVSLDSGDYERARSKFAELRSGFGFIYNHEIERGYLLALIGAGQCLDAIRELEARLQFFPTSPQLNWMLSHACFTQRDRGTEFGSAEWTAMQDKGWNALSIAQHYEPDSGFLYSYGLLEGNPIAPTTLTKEGARASQADFRRALALGNGSWALEALAARMDTVHDASRKAYKEEQKRLFTAALLGALTQQAFSPASSSVGLSSGYEPPSGAGITLPDPVGDQIFSQALNSW